MGEDSARRPGMVDVARLAGVSHQTVSRVLNAPDGVRPATREKVLKAIEQLGYRRNMAARALVTSSSHLIGVVTASSEFFGPASTTSAIEAAARGQGYGTLLTSLPASDEAEIAEAFSFLVNRGVDGIIAVAPRTGIAASATAAARDVPLVVVADGFAPQGRIHVVSVDQELGARMVVRHLIGAGRRRIAYVAGPDDWFDAQARERGWRCALEDSGLRPAGRFAGDWSAESGYEAGTALCLAIAGAPAGQGPDAVFCANDLMALGLLAAARDQGVAVPQALAVVGYDDTAGSEFFAPALTTVSQPFDELGRLCMEVLLGAFDGEPGMRYSISPTLKVRRSSV